MATWKLLQVGVVDLDTGEVVRRENPRWQEYLAFRAAGGEPLPMDPPAPPSPPTPEEQAALAELAAREALRQELRADSDIQALRGRTPAQVDAWIQTNVNTLAEAKAVLRILARVVLLLARERYQ